MKNQQNSNKGLKIKDSKTREAEATQIRRTSKMAVLQVRVKIAVKVRIKTAKVRIAKVKVRIAAIKVKVRVAEVKVKTAKVKVKEVKIGVRVKIAEVRVNRIDNSKEISSKNRIRKRSQTQIEVRYLIIVA